MTPESVVPEVLVGLADCVSRVRQLDPVRPIFAVVALATSERAWGLRRRMTPGVQYEEHADGGWTFASTLPAALRTLPELEPFREAPEGSLWLVVLGPGFVEVSPAEIRPDPAHVRPVAQSLTIPFEDGPWWRLAPSRN